MDLDSEVQGAERIDTAIPRQLVLDYLLHNCYGETARAFMKDDLDAVKDSDSRKGIHTSGNGHRLGLHDGNDGTTSSNGTTHHNGLTVARHMQGGAMAWSTSDGNQQRNENPSSFMEMEKEQELDQEGDSPMADSFVDNPSDHITSGTFTADKAHALHIDEQLKNLETRKEKAIELCNSAFPGVLSIDPHSPLTTPASIQMNFRLQCQLFIEKLRSDPPHEALMFAQKFVQQFIQLDPARKEQYAFHLTDLVSLLAYQNPEEAPSGHHMKQEARDRLAEFMNSAVLGCNGMSCEPALLTIVKQATLVRDILTGETPKIKRGSKVLTKWRLSTFLEESG
ncbi:Ran-binding protein 9 [Mortierella alpina]|nr:Ran-binding protein 9 [Mortierella alpina]